MYKFYTHGEVSCNICFKNNNLQLKDGWKLENNPAYWGHPNPEILVLGYSKGATQMNTEKFDEMAFNGMRPRIKELLVVLNIIDENVDIESLFTENTKEEIGFASFIRCGISLGGKTSGPLINLLKILQ